MYSLPLNKKYWAAILSVLFLFIVASTLYAAPMKLDDQVTMDRIQLVTQQINLLKSRLSQGESELLDLQQKHDKQISGLTIEKVTKSLLDKASLDISVAKSNLDSINIELTDNRQTITWLEKSVQEIENH